jgi:5'-nucleotidase
MKYYLFFFLIIGLLSGCNKEPIHVNKIIGKQLEVSNKLLTDSTFFRTIQPYKDTLKNKIHAHLCYNPKTLFREETPLESSLGNLYADICYKKANTIFHKETSKNIDFALFNYGGIRTVIPKGEITVKNIFELMPFENKLVIVELTGEKTKALFDYLQMRKEAHPISHVQLKIENDKISSILVNNTPFDTSQNYYVLTHDYLQHGGDNMEFFKDPVHLFKTEYKVRDAIIDYLKDIDTIKAKLDGRFVKIK